MIIWPLSNKNMPNHNDMLWLGTFYGLILAIPIIIVWSIYKFTLGRPSRIDKTIIKGIVKGCNKIINYIAFSKEEKAQIAVGTVEKRNLFNDVR